MFRVVFCQKQPNFRLFPMPFLMKFVALLILGLASLPAGAASKPNIIYINTDDWGIGKVPCYGMDPASERIIKTPHIDRLRAEGMRFTNSYAGNAVCGPSRCSLLTGKHPGHAAWRANRDTSPVSPWPPAYPMLGAVARDAGYKTAGFGKLSAGGMSTPEEITACGWDYWLGFLGHIDCRDYYASRIWENGKLVPVPGNDRGTLAGTSFTVGEGKRATAPRDDTRLEAEKGGGVVAGGTFIEKLYGDRIIDFMTRNREEPFFIYFATTVPHGGPPGGMRAPDTAGYDGKSLTLYEKVYCSLMTHHDANIGRIVQAVKDLGLEQDTLILWTSDNGDETSYYGRTGTFDGNGPFRDRKRSLYEGGIRTPLIARWPGTIEPGSECDLITTQWDIMPTVADAGGRPVTPEMDGISILPTLLGQADRQAPREHIYFEFYEGAKQQAVRMGDWKGYRKNGTEGSIELYDLKRDPSETRDLAAAHPDIVARIRDIMAEEHTTSPVWKLPGLDP